MTSQSPWLSTQQLRIWRNWVMMNARLPTVLHRQLQADSELSLQDFEVLVLLTDAEDDRARVSDVARGLQWERSRLSHHVKRMEARGLVLRQECPEDGRGAFVVLTEAGRKAIERAAPGHARIVREIIFDSLTDEELDSLDALTTKVLSRLAATTDA